MEWGERFALVVMGLTLWWIAAGNALFRAERAHGGRFMFFAIGAIVIGTGLLWNRAIA